MRAVETLYTLLYVGVQRIALVTDKVADPNVVKIMSYFPRLSLTKIGLLQGTDN